MKHNLYRKDWYFNPNCQNCMNNHDKLEALREELQQLYAKLCETRISNMKDDAVAFFIEDLLDAEPEEILGKKP